MKYIKFTLIGLLFLFSCAPSILLAQKNDNTIVNSSSETIKKELNIIKQEIDKLKGDNIIKTELNDLKLQINQLKSNLDNQKTSFDIISKANEIMVTASEASVDFVKYILYFLIVAIITSAGGLYWRIKKNFGNQIKQAEDNLNEILQSYKEGISKAIALFYNTLALETWEKYVKAERDNTEDQAVIEQFLGTAIDFQHYAIETLADVFGDDLDDLTEERKKSLITYWQNLAYYLAYIKDEGRRGWAINKAQCAFQWGSEEEQLDLIDKNNKYYKLGWIDTYFFVLKQYDRPQYEDEWLNRYELWRDKLSPRSDLEGFNIYYNILKGRKQKRTVIA